MSEEWLRDRGEVKEVTTVGNSAVTGVGETGGIGAISTRPTIPVGCLICIRERRHRSLASTNLAFASESGPIRQAHCSPEVRAPISKRQAIPPILITNVQDIQADRDTISHGLVNIDSRAITPIGVCAEIKRRELLTETRLF